MRTKVTRREFVAGSIRLAAASQLIQLNRPGVAAQTRLLLGTAERRTLRAAADTIIPARVRMPAASGVGAVAYVERIAAGDRKLNDLLVGGLRALDAASVSTRKRRFDLLAGEQQVEVLARVERDDAPAGFFGALRDLVYEAYYAHPKVMTLLGYAFRSGGRRTAALEAFDDRRLARVRTMPTLYRKVDS